MSRVNFGELLYVWNKKLLILTVNYDGMQYTVFDQLKQRLLKGKMGKERDNVSSTEALSAFSAFVLGAVSKCIATCLTYPAIR